MKKEIIVSVVIAAIVAFAICMFFNVSPTGGASASNEQYQTQYDYAGLSIGTGQTATKINKFSCATLSYNPPALGTSTTASSSVNTDISLPGAVVGDLCEASLSSATTTGVGVGCQIYTNGTSSFRLSNTTGASLDLATGTAKVCYTD